MALWETKYWPVFLLLRDQSSGIGFPVVVVSAVLFSLVDMGRSNQVAPMSSWAFSSALSSFLSGFRVPYLLLFPTLAGNPGHSAWSLPISPQTGLLAQLLEFRSEALCVFVLFLKGFVAF